MKYIYICLSAFVICNNALAEQNINSYKKSLHSIEEMIANNELDKAETTLRALKGTTNPQEEIEKWFLLGQVYMAKSDFTTAIQIYRKILDNQPGLSRVRLELARALFFDKQFQDSEKHFLFVRADSTLPDEVRQKIDIFLALIRQQKNWAIDLSFGIVPDSNINISGKESEECINTIFGVLCRPLETAKSGIGLHLTTEGSYYLRFTKRFGLKTTLGLSLLDFKTSQFDNNLLYFATGPRYVFDKGEVSLQATSSLRWYGGEFYNYSYGVREDMSWQLFNNWVLNTGTSIQQLGYKKDYINDALAGYSWNVYLKPRYFINNKSFVSAGISFEQDNTQEKSYGSDNVSYSIDFFNEFLGGFALFSRIQLTTSNYHGENFFVVDQNIQQKVRKDLTWQFYNRIYNRKLSWHNLTPALSYTYTNRKSNVPNQEFDKHRIELEIIRRF